MNKEELCHMHSLLYELHDYFEQKSGDPIDLSTYDTLDETPQSNEVVFLRKKECIENAVFALLTDITQSLPPETEQGHHERESAVRTRRAHTRGSIQ
jgi:hypothetical protein